MTALVRWEPGRVNSDKNINNYHMCTIYIDYSIDRIANS